MTPIRKDCRLQIVQALHVPRPKNRPGVYRPIYNKKRTSRLSRSASIRVHVDGRNRHGRARGVGAAPRRRRSTKLFDREFQFRESHTPPSDVFGLTRARKRTVLSYIYIRLTCRPSTLIMLKISTAPNASTYKTNQGDLLVLQPF